MNRYLDRGRELVVIGVLILGAFMITACGSGSSTADGKPVTVGSAPEATTEAPTKAAAPLPAAKDFKITLKVLERKCYGTAGCNITYRVNAVQVPEGLDPEAQYEVSYKITGGEDVHEATLTINEGKFDATTVFDEMAQTKSKNTKLTATATAVEIT